MPISYSSWDWPYSGCGKKLFFGHPLPDGFRVTCQDCRVYNLPNPNSEWADRQKLLRDKSEGRRDE